MAPTRSFAQATETRIQSSFCISGQKMAKLKSSMSAERRRGGKMRIPPLTASSVEHALVGLLRELERLKAGTHKSAKVRPTLERSPFPSESRCEQSREDRTRSLQERLLAYRWRMCHRPVRGEGHASSRGWITPTNTCSSSSLCSFSSRSCARSIAGGYRSRYCHPQSNPTSSRRWPSRDAGAALGRGAHACS
jgi:hypothetical protein